MSPSTEEKPCRACLGKGRVPKPHDTIPAALPPEIEFETCSKCKGTGVSPEALPNSDTTVMPSRRTVTTPKNLSC